MHSQCGRRPSSRALHMQGVCFAGNIPNVVLGETDGYGVVVVKVEVEVNEVLEWVAEILRPCKNHSTRCIYAAAHFEYDLRMLRLDRHDERSDRGSIYVSISQFTI